MALLFPILQQAIRCLLGKPVFLLFADEDQRRLTAVSHLLLAACVGNLQRLNKFAAELNRGETLAETLVRAKDSDHRTALHFAAAGGSTEVCKYLIEELKLDVNIQDYYGETPLHIAIDCKQYSTAVYLLDIGANPNSADRKRLAPLHYAVLRGHEEAVKLLIERGAEIDPKASVLGTPLYVAAAHGKKDVLNILLEHKANPNAVAGRSGTPLTSAIFSDSLDCMELLLKAGADPNLMLLGVTPINCVDRPNTVADLFIRPLVTAMVSGNFACVERLLQAGADPNLESYGIPPLFWAVVKGNTDAVKLMLKYGADANVTHMASGITLLEAVAMDGHPEICEILFPIAIHIPYINDWTLEGVLKYVDSKEAEDRREVKRKEYFMYAKSRGEASFKNEDYLDAIFWYSQALEAEEKNAVVLSNKSLCWARLEKGKRALIDAQHCIRVKRDWHEAHYRAGVAYTLLKDYVKAVNAFSNALKLDPHNKEIQAALREAVSAKLSKSTSAPTSSSLASSVPHVKPLFIRNLFMIFDSSMINCIP